MYYPMGAGPGQTMTYRVDLPLPWGRDTEITLPVQALVDDAWLAMEPNVSGAISKGAMVIAASVAVAVGLAALWIKKG
jgi:hypothetical protein